MLSFNFLWTSLLLFFGKGDIHKISPQAKIREPPKLAREPPKFASETTGRFNGQANF